MATAIQSSCPECGDVTLRVEDVTLVRADDKVEYIYNCPKCGKEVRKRADKKIATLLVGAGVEWQVVVPHPEEHPDGPPLTIDDLIDLHFELEEL